MISLTSCIPAAQVNSVDKNTFFLNNLTFSGSLELNYIPSEVQTLPDAELVRASLGKVFIKTMISRCLLTTVEQKSFLFLLIITCAS